MKSLLIADVSNLYLCAKAEFNGRLDYTKLIDIHKPSRAVAYGALGEQDQSGFMQILKDLGFELQFKEYKVFSKEGEPLVRKMDWDVKIAVDVIRWIPRFDKLILCSADGEFAPLVTYVRDSGATVHVEAINISRDLKEAANSYREFTEYDMFGPTN